MTVDEALRTFPYDSSVSPADRELMSFETYLQRTRTTPKQFSGVLREMVTGNDLTVSHGTITSIGSDEWPGVEPMYGKSAEAYVHRGGTWKVRVEENDTSASSYFGAYPEKKKSFTGTLRHEDYSGIRFDVWCFQTSITFENGRVVSTKREEIPD